MRRQGAAAATVPMLLALVSVTLELANDMTSTDHISTSTLAVNFTTTSGISSTWSPLSTNSTTTSVHSSAISGSLNAHSSSAATPSASSTVSGSSIANYSSSAAPAASSAISGSSIANSSSAATSAASSTVAIPANDTTVSLSANSTVTDNVTDTIASSTTAVLSTMYGPTTAAVSSTTYKPTVPSSTTAASASPTSDANKVLIAVLAVIIPILVLVIIAGVLFFYRKKLKKSCGDKDGESISEASLALPQYTSLVVNVDEFLEHVNDMQKECDFKYAQQFESLQLVGREQTTDQALLKCNVEKNRYINIHPYDITRVKLLPVESEEGSDYVNASWIPGYYSKREYIAAQGPLPTTEDDMWRVVWEYKCKGIIMLTKCMEGGRKKCDQYWPEDNEPVVYGDIQVVLVSEASEENKWTIKKLELSVGQQKRTIKLCHFIEWPDNGVPESPEVLLEFMQIVKKELETTKAGPLVIHCSAGVGRTGTYIAIETLLLQMENERQVDVFGIVYRLRLNRVFMVQTEVQYKFIHETIGHVIRKQNENETLSEDTTLLNHNDLQPATDPEHVQMTEIEVNSYKAPDLQGIDNLGFEFSSQT